MAHFDYEHRSICCCSVGEIVNAGVDIPDYILYISSKSTWGSSEIADIL